MADKYKEYLAVNVLNEDRVVGFPFHSPLTQSRRANRGVVQVSYRSLSRALKVHSNLAKQMLYDFHRKQTAKKPGSVHATYLIAGTCRPDTPIQANEVNGHDGEDRVMQSSPPFPSSSMPQQEESVEEDVTVKLLLLAKEEDLEAKVAPRPSTATLAKDEKTPNTKPGDDTKLSRRASSSHTPQADEATVPSSKKTTVKAPTLKRDKSDVFKTFAKSKAKLRTEDSAGSAGAPSAPESGEPSAAEDEPMKDVSEDEQEDDFVLVNSKETEDANRRSKAEKAEREERLRKMMEEEEDEPMNDAPSIAGMDDSQDQLLTQKTESQQSAEQEPEATTTASGGRRRGRRRVMKKKTVKDEEGYLVTKEEPVWESFSEDEPVAKKVKMPTAVATTAKGKKCGGGGKSGQGNIMSFFSKK
ncbi:hypothetical protein LTR39_003865 [Cryomyces antarcticus]|nr:hypothetical protein LTR39_003865 [Cryomyces antarcticus]